jgi:hypothetical protein
MDTICYNIVHGYYNTIAEECSRINAIKKAFHLYM